MYLFPHIQNIKKKSKPNNQTKQNKLKKTTTQD